jgi:hypothetical protein
MTFSPALQSTSSAAVASRLITQVVEPTMIAEAGPQGDELMSEGEESWAGPQQKDPPLEDVEEEVSGAGSSGEVEEWEIREDENEDAYGKGEKEDEEGDEEDEEEEEEEG